jgi:hypothetical protein
MINNFSCQALRELRQDSTVIPGLRLMNAEEHSDWDYSWTNQYQRMEWFPSIM